MNRIIDSQKCYNSDSTLIYTIKILKVFKNHQGSILLLITKKIPYFKFISLT